MGKNVVSVRCQCGTEIRVDKRLAGRLGRCPRCRKEVRIPGPIPGGPISSAPAGRTASRPAARPAEQPPRAWEDAGGQEPPLPLAGESPEETSANALDVFDTEDLLIPLPLAPRAAIRDEAPPASAVKTAGVTWDGGSRKPQPLISAAQTGSPRPPNHPAGPGAGAIVQPAASAPLPGLQGRSRPMSTFAKNSPFVAAGFLILSTILIPWYVGTVPTFFGGMEGGLPVVWMSWHVIQHGPGLLTAFLLVAWYIGLAAVVAGFCLRGLPLAICNASHGAVGVLFMIVVLLALAGSPGSPDYSPAAQGAVFLLEAAAFLVLLPMLEVRRQLGRLPATRVLQAVSGGALCILLVVGFILAVATFAEVPNRIRRDLAVVLLLSTLMQVLLLVGAILAVVDAARPESGSDILAQVAKWFFNGAFVIFGAGMVIGSAAAGGPLRGLSLAILNFGVLIIYPLLLLFLGGTAQVIVEAVWAGQRKRAGEGRGQPASEADEPAQYAPSAQAAQRLQQLQKLYDDGLITQEEFLARRASIVESV